MAVKAVKESGALLGFRGIALEVDNVAIEDYIVTNLNLGIAFCPFLVSKIEDTESREFGIRYDAVVCNIKCTIAILGAESFLD